MAAATTGAVAAATCPKTCNAKLQNSHHAAEAAGEQQQIGAHRRVRHSASISDNSSSSDGHLRALVNGGGGGAGELLVFDDEVQIPVGRQHSSAARFNSSNAVGGTGVDDVTTSKQTLQLNQQDIISRRSMNVGRHQQHADLKRHRSSGTAPLSPTRDLVALSEFLPPPAFAANSPGSHEQLINTSVSPLNGGSVPSASSLHPTPAAALLKQASPLQAPATKQSVSLSPESTREFLASLHREQLSGLGRNTSASLLPSYADATATSSTTAPSTGSAALLPNVVVPPRKKFNVTRVVENDQKSAARANPPAQTAARPTALVDYDHHNFFDTLGPIISSTRTLADYRPGIGASGTPGDSSAAAATGSRHPQYVNSAAYQHLVSGHSAGNAQYPLTTNTEEAIPFLLGNSQYRLPGALRRSQRARSEYLPYPPQQAPQQMVSSFRLGAGGNSGAGGGAVANGHAAAAGTTSSTIAAAVKGSALGAALLTGSPMSTLPYKAPTKSPRYLPVSIQAAGYAPTTMEMKDLPPLGSADSQKHLDTLHHHQHGGHQPQNVTFREYPSHAAALVGTVSAAVLTGTSDSVHNRNPFDMPPTMGNDLLNSTSANSNYDASHMPNSGGHLDAHFSENDQNAAAVRMAVQNSADAGNNIAGGTMSRPNFHRSTTLPLYMAEAGKTPQTQGFGHRFGKKRARARLLHRTGNYNMIGKNIPHRRIRLVSDIWNTLVDLQWRYILLLFLLSYFLTWTLFAFIYWLISLSHGDFDAENLNSADWRPCVQNLRSFTTAYLFSVESQHTIGYGFRYITDECAEAIIFLCLQSAIGAAIQAFMTGLVFTKVQRPTKRAQTLLFSKHAVICTRDGQLCLLFRVGNMRRSLIIQSSVTAQLVHHRKTIEGELLPFHQHEMHIQLDSMSSSAFLAWPMTACHIINDESPLYDLDKQSMQNARFELIVTLEGVIESTGQTLQARTSYLPEEILWGFRFAKLLSYRQSSGQYVVNFERFHKVEIAPETPVCSAAQLEVAKRAFVARQSLEDDDELAPDEEMLREQHYRQQQLQHHVLSGLGNGAKMISINDSGDEEEEDVDDAGKLPMSAPPISSMAANAVGLPKSRVATITSLLAHEAEHANASKQTGSTASSTQHLHLPAAADRRAKFFSGDDDNDLNETGNNSPKSSSVTMKQMHPAPPPPFASQASRKYSHQHHQSAKRKFERKSSGDLPVLFTVGPPPSQPPPSKPPVLSHASFELQRDSLSRHASEAELEQHQQRNQRRKRGSAGKIMLGSSDDARLRAAADVDNNLSVPMHRGPAHKSSASFSRPKSHNSLRIPGTGGAPPPSSHHHPLSQPQFSDEERKRSGGLEKPTAAGFETEQESAAHVWTSPENRKYLELLKKELPEHDQQLLRRRKLSTKKLHHGADMPSSDVDAYEETMARMRRLGSILDDPKYTFDLTAEADELRNTSGTSSVGVAPAHVRAIRTHKRVGSERRLSGNISDDDGEGGYIRDDEPDDMEQTFPSKPTSTTTGGKMGLGGTSSLRGSSVRLSDLLPLSNMQAHAPHEVADQPIAEEVDSGGSPTHHQNIVVVMPPTRPQSDAQLLEQPPLSGGGRDMVVHIQNETGGEQYNFRKSVGSGPHNTAGVHHAEMARRSSANAAIAGPVHVQRQNSTTSQMGGGHSRHQHQQSRHASVKRAVQMPKTNSTLETEPGTWLPFPSARPPPQQPPPTAPP